MVPDRTREREEHLFVVFLAGCNCIQFISLSYGKTFIVIALSLSISLSL
jgi:hypothetical protein